METRIITVIKIAMGIHKGDVTHHQDQLIQFVSFNTMKTIVRSPQKPISLPFELLFVPIFFVRLPDTPEGFYYFKSYRFHLDKATHNSERKQ